MTLPMMADADPDDTFAAHNEDRAPQDDSKAVYGDKPVAGELLTLPENEAAALAVKLFCDQSKRGDVRKREAQWEVNRLRRLGYCNVELVKTENQQQWKARQLPGVSRIVPGWNKADDLCQKILDNLFIDPPGPEPVPSSGDEDDVDAAEFAERALREVQSEGHLDDLECHREAFDLSSTYSKAGIKYVVDPQAVRGPVMILAAAGAMHAEQPFHVEQLGQVDPLTGIPGPPSLVQAPPPYVLRYVTATGQLTDDKTQAAERWYPKLVGEVLDPRHYRYLPATARDLWAAEGVVCAGFKSISELRSLSPDKIGVMSEEELRKLTEFRPPVDTKSLWPDGAPKETTDGPLDDRLAFYVTVTYKSCAAYAAGCDLFAVGKDTLVRRGPWEATLPDGSKESLDIPMTEYIQFWRGRGEPVALMELLGPANEQRAAVVGHWLQSLEDYSNRAVFVSQYGTLRAEDLETRNSKYLYYQPGHAPVFEDIPPFPGEAMAFFQQVGGEMDSSSGLEQAAQGVEDPSVKSGAHAREIRSASLVNLGGLQQNTARAYTRGCRVQLQLIRWQFTIPQQIGWVGEDGIYRQRYWTGSDLRGTKDVRLKKGTLTMLSQSAKAQEAVYYSQIGGDPRTGAAGLIDPMELREILGDRVGGELGLKDNPHRQRIKRQIQEWTEGPPEGWQPPQPIGVDPMTGQPQMAPDPINMGIWAPVPADQEQAVAQVRHFELSRCMGTTKYARQPPGWRLAFDAEYQRMRQAAGVATVAEQQQAQMQAQQQQQQAEQAKAEQAHGHAMAKGEQQGQQKQSQQASAQEAEAGMAMLKAQQAAVGA